MLFSPRQGWNYRRGMSGLSEGTEGLGEDEGLWGKLSLKPRRAHGWSIQKMSCDNGNDSSPHDGAMTIDWIGRLKVQNGLD